MTTVGYVLSGIGCFLIVSTVLAWLIGGGVADADRYEGRHTGRRIGVAVEDQIEDDPPAIGFPAGGEPCCCGRPGCDGTGPWPDDVPLRKLGDTLVEVGTELVHRRCADARRDGRVPGECCAARLGGQPV